MKLFECQSCGNPLYFENTRCERCHRQTGYLPELDVMSAVEPDGVQWKSLADPGTAYRFCANWELRACNWLVRADDGSAVCRACRHNRTIPDISDPARHVLWQRVEQAKRRLIYSLIKLGLPLPSAADGEQAPLVFDFLADLPEQKVMTGHGDGVITLSLAEADDAVREKLRTSLHEPYRTLLGHFRHEIGHFYWDRLVRDGGHLASFRACFGDERVSYSEALERYYANGPAPNWQERHVSAYSTMHPWEDFAETWAHYLHIVDTLEMAYAFHLSISPRVEEAPGTTVDRNPYHALDVPSLMEAWLPVTFAVNSLNRSMGQPDLYPFIVSPAAITKLQYVHDLIRGRLAQPAAAADGPPSRKASALRRLIGRLVERAAAKVPALLRGRDRSRPCGRAAQA